jgi:hypothetical protein
MFLSIVILGVNSGLQGSTSLHVDIDVNEDDELFRAG